MYGKRTISLEFDGSSKSVRIPLDGDAGGTFAAGDSEALAHLDTPFFVRVKGTGGDSSITTTFADQPEPGYAATIVHDGDSNNTVVPLRELHLHPDCSFTGGKS